MIFELSDIANSDNLIKEFCRNSVIKINKLIDPQICNMAHSYFLNNEKQIIAKYSNDARGLVLDEVNGKNFIKYFEYPLAESFKVFGPFINNNLFRISEILLDSQVYLRSMEIHTRGEGSTEIPAHQDNTYYGLVKGNALTFYIAINPQSASSGGLTYIPNNHGNEFKHKASNSKAFSLCIDEKNLPKNIEHFCPTYSIGDCTIHHSHSIHYAKEVKKTELERSLVVRLTFFGVDSKIREGHEEWYKKMVSLNRK